MPREELDPPRPTDAELETLTVFQYTTVLKLLQIMCEKGLVRRDEKQRAHAYQARRPREWTQKQLAGDLLQRAFSGPARRTSKRELTEIRRVLDEYEEGNR
jgi:BlaI family transcriptional regulator, penicillinase repressor